MRQCIFPGLKSLLSATEVNGLKLRSAHCIMLNTYKKGVLLQALCRRTTDAVFGLLVTWVVFNLNVYVVHRPHSLWHKMRTLESTKYINTE